MTAVVLDRITGPRNGGTNGTSQNLEWPMRRRLLEDGRQVCRAVSKLTAVPGLIQQGSPPAVLSVP